MRYLLAILFAFPVAPGLAAKPHESAELAAQREKMKNIKRRIILQQRRMSISIRKLR